ncbi:Pkinase-domain-containing protein [Tothia fuscella]|uniref:Pkinase-domain-containing protein n=1 Tax=Tothia fuscella TaxID=1048955 RepID=A0A9P4P4N5_9PEZI|nr:Pkinase-domain-containing protein [Tothia fuscella]
MFVHGLLRAYANKRKAEAMDDDATQPATQQVLDPRRIGRNNSGLNDSDVSDVICILHPSSLAAFKIVSNTADHSPQHVLQSDSLATFDEEHLDPQDLEEQDTFVLNDDASRNVQDLALRMSSTTVSPILGFCFGRNARSCDIVIDVDSVKRVSNLHFRIFINPQGVLMLEDMSTNGTLVDDKHLKGKNARSPATRMLTSGSIIQIPSTKAEESVKFIVRIPSRAGHTPEFSRNVHAYLNRMALAEKLHYEQAQRHGQFVQPHSYLYLRTAPMPPPNPHGMNWDGGEEYNVVGLLGKGAFATVYKLATKRDGHLFAAKELEKKRFIKNGRMDQRLDNEMQIMKSIKHPNIVDYTGYEDHHDHLYIIMEFVPCGDLQQYLKAHKTLPEPEARLMSRQVLDALHYLHGKQITHRDIKPDNILLASIDPFNIKLSDFGLSKVVATNETFLKTFCGTLLYCAPEVFPHYEEHVQKKGQKRRRTGPSTQSNFHQYSQSVDIWSYAAVLWLSLCGTPPFEGVVDHTGRGMFTKIMETQLDINPLLSMGTSANAIDLLNKMLTTDPAARFNEVECLNHPWLTDGKLRIANNLDLGLNAIIEEEEAGIVTQGARAFSQLSIGDAQANAQAGAALVDYSSGDFDFLDPRISKRVRADEEAPNPNQIREQAAIRTSSSGIFPYEGEVDAGHPQPTQSTPRQPRLFGEIGESALKDSGTLGVYTTNALAMQQPSEELSSGSQGVDFDMDGVDLSSFQEGQVTSNMFRSDGGAFTTTSLLGTEAMVGELNMESPNSAFSQDVSSEAHSFEPQTPPSPERVVENSKSPSQKRPSQDITPKQQKKPFDRQIRMNIPTELLYDPLDPRRRTASSPLSSLPATVRNSVQLNDTTNGSSKLSSAVTIPSDFPNTSTTARYGTLTTTKDSFLHMVLKIDSHVMMFGRDPLNTEVFSDVYDTRVGKKAIGVFYNAPGLTKMVREEKDWTRAKDLHVVVKTFSAKGILINGVKLPPTDGEGVNVCGRLYTGDVITVFRDMALGGGGKRECLKFVCYFSLGEAAGRRPEHKPFEIIPAVEQPYQQ